MSTIGFLAVCAVLFVSYVRYLERKSLFYPAKKIMITPKEVHLDYEDVYFETQDHVRLNGWFIPAAQAKSTVLYLHGNAGNIGDRLAKIEIFHDIGVNVFIVSYRGFGNSEGSPTESGMYKDALAGYDYLLTHKDIDTRKIIGYGASLGGAAAVDLAGQRRLSCLIVDSTFTSAVDMARRIYPFIPSFLVKLKLDSIGKIKGVRIPKLFIHSLDDTTVPFALGKKLFDTADAPKEFLQLKGSHNDSHLECRQEFVDGIKGFLKKNNAL